MIRYHLARVFRPRLLLVLAVIIYLTLAFYRRGGVETGDLFAYSEVLQYWATITPLLLVGLVAGTPAGWASRPEHDPITLTRPGAGRAAADSLARLLALAAPVALIGVLSSAYLSTRVPDAAGATFRTADLPDPVTVGAVWSVFFVGPLTGSVALLALSELAGTLLRSTALRIVIVGFVAFMDAINRLGSPLLSLSGTALKLVHGSHWGRIILDQDGQPFEGTVTVQLSFGLILSRVLLVLLAVALSAALGLLRVRGLQRATAGAPMPAPRGVAR